MELAQLQKFVTSIHPLTKDEGQAFASIWQLFSCKRKTVLTAAGETERSLYFVLSGVQRGFYVGAKNKDATLVFTYPYSFSGIADSFLTATPSAYFLETLTASTFLKTTYQQVLDLAIQYPAIQQLLFKATALALKGVLERQIELQCFTAEQKFRSLLNPKPTSATTHTA